MTARWSGLPATGQLVDLVICNIIESRAGTIVHQRVAGVVRSSSMRAAYTVGKCPAAAVN
jgi:hypothetical protein